MRKILSLTFALFVALTAIGLASKSAQAVVTWTWNGTRLTGAQNVDVNGTLYNVTFGTGSCQAVFTGCDNAVADFAFTTEADARAAGQALLDQVFLDINTAPGSPHFDTNPSLILGCGIGNPNICLASIPYLLTDGTVTFAYAQNETVEASDIVPLGSAAFPTFYDNALTNGVYTWARFSVVPIPPALLLFISGLVAFFGVARSGRREAKAEV